MSDDLTKALAEALGCEPADFWPWSRLGQPPLTTCATHNSNGVWPCTEAERIAAALTPLIEARVREAWDEGYNDGLKDTEERLPNPYGESA